ncbi:tyrosine-protein phosphatase [Paenibacillus apiarius]|uniref:Tyrosine-protein phosphatase n=1 Tax=Paenibacillus apiarius TaxID=46240 RepID=A0ABT4DNI0_9BACL|nr:tyrosine-protein phosphatase [Paenibacillus apiarius]MCY9515509.1 tyrosine-protein phosphatase [Paenibacillus apiarius]MCY9518918.1 tyrosine-protein phosphatase [Paenibacillus apiarius]MCY9552036.1 tyrosine-protein phosphatase [Paenibacillus apiarius]MCY9557288.1 tyrosine-protein phosphatase [Paenibacillus apiarius]MCY9682533.1 tyrosine-protein phosphatase [Paenibacillus apiarius]
MSTSESMIPSARSAAQAVQAELTRGSAPGKLSLRLSDGRPDAEYEVYSSPSPDWNREHASFITSTTGTEGNALEIDDPTPGRRCYIHVMQSGYSVLTVGERVLPLAGGSNFRDLGGYVASDGRRVRWGRLFRSAELSELTADDVSYLDSLHLRALCDFRDSDETASMPSPPLQTVNSNHIPLMQAAGSTAIRQTRDIFRQPSAFNASEPGQLLVDLNRSLVHSTAGIRSVFELLLREDGAPLLFHCTAGKDRTGLMAALILIAIGVPKETVMHDYMLTNTYLNVFNLRLKTEAKMADSLGLMNPDVLQAVMEARPEYLTAAFKEMEQAYGGVHSYLEDALGLTETDIEELKRKLLEQL